MGDHAQIHDAEANEVQFIDFIDPNGTSGISGTSPRNTHHKRKSTMPVMSATVPESWQLDGNLKKDPLARSLLIRINAGYLAGSMETAPEDSPVNKLAKHHSEGPVEVLNLIPDIKTHK